MRAALLAIAIVPFALLGDGAMGAPSNEEDGPATHNMLVVGNQTVFLSHLPMFDELNSDGTEYTSPHRWQVILQAAFKQPSAECGAGNDVTSIYKLDREKHEDVRMYTLQPKDFILSRLFTPAMNAPTLACMTATIFRGHLERGGSKISGLGSVAVHVTKVIYANKFDPKAVKPQHLTYILFGGENEIFLAHMITAPPDFDQILSVKVADHQFSADELSRGVKLTLAGRSNIATGRLRPGQTEQAVAEFLSPPRAPPFKVQVLPGVEYYFEESELAMPPNFGQTAEEKKSGF